MKNGILLTALVLVLPLFILGCHDDNNNGNGATALTENDFANDPNLRADPQGGVIVKFLEHPDGERPENDTGEVGSDTIPFTYPETVEHTLCWEDENLDAMHFAELRDSEGSLILTVEANGECATAVITPGDYEMRLQHDGITDDDISVFLQVVEGANGLGARGIETDQGKLERLFSWTFGNIGIVETAMAQTVEENVDTLLTTRSCQGCDLRGVDLKFAFLQGTNLTNANLTDANLSRANLDGANLTGADLSDADLSEAELMMANLRLAILIGANLESADLSDANMTNTRIDGASLNFAILTDTDLTDANLSDANLSNANLNVANLPGANLTNANLTAANLNAAILTGANFSGADLSLANLIGANLFGANLSNSNLFGTSFAGAQWCDGCVCTINSNGTCGGCPPVEEVCTGS